MSLYDSICRSVDVVLVKGINCLGKALDRESGSPQRSVCNFVHIALESTQELYENALGAIDKSLNWLSDGWPAWWSGTGWRRLCRVLLVGMNKLVLLVIRQRPPLLRSLA